MITLDSKSLPAFLERFNSFNDALIRRIEHRYLALGVQETTLTLSGWDEQSSTGRSNVIVVISEVSELLFQEGKSTRQVLSDGMTVAWFDGVVWCDLSPYTSEPDSIEDFRKSDFYVVGKVLTWRTEPYS